MPSPIPRWTRWVESLVGRRLPAGHLSPATTAFPRTQMGRRPRPNLSGPHRRFTCVTACLLAGPPSGPLRRRLRRLRDLRRRSDCYRLERPSCRAGVAPAEDSDLFTAHYVPFSGLSPFPGLRPSIIVAAADLAARAGGQGLPDAGTRDVLIPIDPLDDADGRHGVGVDRPATDRLLHEMDGGISEQD